MRSDQRLGGVRERGERERKTLEEGGVRREHASVKSAKRILESEDLRER